jgi:hypothetical protein
VHPAVDYREHNVNYNYLAQEKASIIKSLPHVFCLNSTVGTKGKDQYPQCMVVWTPQTQNG